MNRFVKKVTVFIIIISLCCCGIAVFDFFVAGSQYEYAYQASILDKMKRLENINESKIILVGNSNLSFGIDSKKIEDAFGMPVVNLGLHGGLGNVFHEEMARQNIGAGDIVVVCHSTFSDNDEITDRFAAWTTIDNHIELGKLIRQKDYFAMLQAYPNYLKNAMFLWLTRTGNIDRNNCYSRSAFNEYGDVVNKPESGQMDVDAYFAETEISVPEVNDICTERLNQFNAYIVDCGASMVIAGYPVAYGKYAVFDEEDFRTFQRNLQDAVDCAVISDYTDYFYPYRYFYNTNLHLTTEGTKVRTDQLIIDLREWMAGNVKNEKTKNCGVTIKQSAFSVDSRRGICTGSHNAGNSAGTGL